MKAFWVWVIAVPASLLGWAVLANVCRDILGENYETRRLPRPPVKPDDNGNALLNGGDLENVAGTEAPGDEGAGDKTK